MLVYGDVEQRRAVADIAGKILRHLEFSGSTKTGLDRHMGLVAAFIALGDLLRARIDAAMPERDDLVDDPGLDALMQLARAVDASWTLSFDHQIDLLPVKDYLRQQQTDSGTVRLKPLEGYAFYALYPEAYAEAARRSGLPQGTRVIGIRSIGLGLAAMVAAALYAAPPFSVRPRGHPFDRHLDLSDALADALLADDPPTFAVVDEGPGLSGSSFGSVADWLVAHGVPRQRIHFFPNHLNLGDRASDARRRHWAAAPRHVVDTDELLLEKLRGWTADLLGSRCEEFIDITGGGRRSYLRGRAAQAPTASAFERRKFRVTAGGETWTLRFAGLGEIGAEKLRLARNLHAAGFGPEPAGLLHGFLVQRWIDAPSLVDAPLTRPSLLEQLADYLAFRASLSAPADAGAPLQKLFDMARFNTAEALGPEIANRLAGQLPDPDALERRVHRVQVDARLHAWEWLVQNGKLLKLDALDHACAHDFVGAQDIAWDVAGAIEEHDLSDAESETVLKLLADRGVTVDPELLAALRPSYLAFQLGCWSMGAGPQASVTSTYAKRLETLARTSPAP